MNAASFGAATHVGAIRSLNEDQYVAAPPVFVVADGMGGHAHGDVASSIVADAFRRLAAQPNLDAEAVSACIREAHSQIRAESTHEHEMGTTVVGAVLLNSGSDPSWLVFNVGDSRAYLYKSGELTQVSHDHSLVQELVDLGAVDEGDAQTHPDRNVVTRALGIETSLEPDFWMLQPVPGSRLILCSDGLHGELTDDQIELILELNEDPQAAADTLITQAVQAGGHDNVTVVVVETDSAKRRDAADLGRDDTQPTKVIEAVPSVSTDGPPVALAAPELIDEVPVK